VFLILAIYQPSYIKGFLSSAGDSYVETVAFRVIEGGSLAGSGSIRSSSEPFVKLIVFLACLATASLRLRRFYYLSVRNYRLSLVAHFGLSATKPSAKSLTTRGILTDFGGLSERNLGRKWATERVAVKCPNR